MQATPLAWTCIIAMVLVTFAPATASPYATEPSLEVTYNHKSGGVGLTWPDQDDAATYHLYRNGLHIGQTTATEHADQLLPTEPAATYTVVVGALEEGGRRAQAFVSPACSMATIFFTPDEKPWISVVINDECMPSSPLSPKGASAGSTAESSEPGAQ